MKLFTPEQYQQLLLNGSAENRDKDHPPVAQLLLPGTNCIWLLSEIEPEQPNIAFGLCDLGLGFPELGYVDLDELQSVKKTVYSVFTFSVFCNTAFEGKYPMSVYADAARAHERIVWDDKLLMPYLTRNGIGPKPPELKP